MVNKIALICIATSEPYRSYAEKMANSAEAYFPEHDLYLFTDQMNPNVNTFQITISAQGKLTTLYRYHILLQQEAALKEYSHTFMIDADMLFMNTAKKEDLLFDGIVSVQHPKFYRSPHHYAAGAFIGGESGSFLNMARSLRTAIDVYEKCDAKWPDTYDEWFLNGYLRRNPPTKVLTPAYCYPEIEVGYEQVRSEFTPILVAREKAYGVNSLD